MTVGMAAPRAPFACDPDGSRGRLFAEPPSRTRSPFRRDCDRVIHSNAFRRLKHKTQVFVFHEGDHYRTRLTHSLEVAQIARALARQLGLDEDLTETLALAHDLGHPPFGHAGERALDACLRDHGGFDHNAQALRVVTALEHRYPDFDGLNLTWESLEGIVKHNGPLTERDGSPIGSYREHGVPAGIADYVRNFDLELWSFASMEAQVAAIADDIAYDAHDIDDGLRAGLFRVDDLKVVPLISDIIAETARHYPRLDDIRRGAELVRELISYLIGAVMAEAGQRIATAQPQSAQDVRTRKQALIAFPAEIARAEAEIKAFLFQRMYRHTRVMRVMGEAEQIVIDLFERYRKSPGDLPTDWLDATGEETETERARRIGNFIAGMTDRYALIEHQRLFDSTPDLR
ncbi:deoxyguanosinetriphosphate triphosphohydrolase [Bradyrhizobium sp.]|uniref:deoxyguanosinetriphosphate triphosphohydrolase n=1 Tax=Bradyrhizobium sp. TaxID=376 RepID=UPI001D236996|nr:deoxyguanosinetriphosphate triphosphohydrolase [Bradyrhizobium sp.]MBI5319740.1 deoxyguanosinetriphosphate triphosphohydrolase [Bradyrhizobium sp.]